MSRQGLVKPARVDAAGDVGDRVAAFLRRTHPIKTGFAVEAACGVPAETVRNWTKGTARPSLVHFLALIGAYGPEFLVAVWPDAPDWIDAAARARRAARLAARLAEVEREIARDRGEGARAAPARVAAP